jgi:nicotinamide/nicotinate riboside kinase
LQSILPNSNIVHQDDFYLADKDIPLSDKGIADWDCPEAFDLELMRKTLRELKETGYPKEFKSYEDNSSTGPANVTAEQIRKATEDLMQLKLPERTVIVEGIMLYHQDSPVISELDHKLFLRAPYEDLKYRRENRAGYITIEGYWQDPPGYFDDIVWPGYEKSHRYLFENQDVNGHLSDFALQKIGLQSPSDINIPMSTMVEWAVQSIKDHFTKVEIRA